MRVFSTLHLAGWVIELLLQVAEDVGPNTLRTAIKVARLFGAI